MFSAPVQPRRPHKPEYGERSVSPAEDLGTGRNVGATARDCGIVREDWERAAWRASSQFFVMTRFSLHANESERHSVQVRRDVILAITNATGAPTWPRPWPPATAEWRDILSDGPAALSVPSSRLPPRRGCRRPKFRPRETINLLAALRFRCPPFGGDPVARRLQVAAKRRRKESRSRSFACSPKEDCDETPYLGSPWGFPLPDVRGRCSRGRRRESAAEQNWCTGGGVDARRGSLHGLP